MFKKTIEVKSILERMIDEAKDHDSVITLFAVKFEQDRLKHKEWVKGFTRATGVAVVGVVSGVILATVISNKE